MAQLPEQALCQDAMQSGQDIAAAIQAIDAATWDYSGLDEEEWYCALVAGHPGSHIVHVQTSPDDREWWLRWGDGVIRLVSEPICDPEDDGQDDADGETYCLLPDGHYGPHTDGEIHWSGEHPAGNRGAL